MRVWRVPRAAQSVANAAARRSARRHAAADAGHDAAEAVGEAAAAGADLAAQTAADAAEAVSHAGEVLYSDPIPHVLMLTAIVVGVATLALGLSFVLLAVALLADGRPSFWLYMPILGVLLATFMFLLPNLHTAALAPMGAVAGTATSFTGAVRIAGGALLAVFSKLFLYHFIGRKEEYYRRGEEEET